MLVARGHAATSDSVDRAALVTALAGSQTYPTRYLDELRDERPS